MGKTKAQLKPDGANEARRAYARHLATLLIIQEAEDELGLPLRFINLYIEYKRALFKQDLPFGDIYYSAVGEYPLGNVSPRATQKYQEELLQGFPKCLLPESKGKSGQPVIWFAELLHILISQLKFVESNNNEGLPIRLRYWFSHISRIPRFYIRVEAFDIPMFWTPSKPEDIIDQATPMLERRIHRIWQENEQQGWFETVRQFRPRQEFYNKVQWFCWSLWYGYKAKGLKEDHPELEYYSADQINAGIKEIEKLVDVDLKLNSPASRVRQKPRPTKTIKKPSAFVERSLPILSGKQCPRCGEIYGGAEGAYPCFVLGYGEACNFCAENLKRDITGETA